MEKIGQNNEVVQSPPRGNYYVLRRHESFHDGKRQERIPAASISAKKRGKR
jgi:hypothetical protein